MKNKVKKRDFFAFGDISAIDDLFDIGDSDDLGNSDNLGDLGAALEEFGVRDIVGFKYIPNCTERETFYLYNAFIFRSRVKIVTLSLSNVQSLVIRTKDTLCPFHQTYLEDVFREIYLKEIDEK